MVKYWILLSLVLKASAFQTAPPPLSSGFLQRRQSRLYMTEDGEVTTRQSQNGKQQQQQKRVVVVGAGWAGFGAARHLAQQGYQVMLLDGAEDPGGAAAGMRTPQGRVVEAGIKGFWYQYKNIFRLLDELNLSNELTDWTGSSFWSPKGLEVDAPVFQRQPKLPTPLGQFVHTLPTFTNLPVSDRLSLWRLMFAMVDYQTDYERYDSMSVADLMRENGVSDRFYKEFIRPLLLAMLFAPPEDLSAAVIIGSFYFLVLGGQENFDVRWCRGSIGERIFRPLLEDFKTNNGGVVEGGRFVTDIEMEPDKPNSIRAVIAKGKDGKDDRYEADAVIFSVGINAMKKLIYQIPTLAGREEFRKVMQLRSSDCIATRIWFDKRVQYKAVRNPSNVFSGFDNDVGSTFFVLNDLQDEFKDKEHGTVIASDFYHASSMLPLSDEDIIQQVHDQLKKIDSGFNNVNIIDSAVIRAPQCSTMFSPGSYRSRPKQETSIDNLILCGDWVKEEPMHGADGLSQERALVTGLYAANILIEKTGFGKKINILQTDKDEPHIEAAKNLNSVLKDAAKASPLPLPPPFSFLK